MFEPQPALPNAAVIKLQDFDQCGELISETVINLHLIKPENRQFASDFIAKEIGEMNDGIR